MSCAALGDLGAVCQRVQALERYWRPEKTENIRQRLTEAAGLPALQAAARETLRMAEDELSQVKPDGAPSTQARWRELQGTVTHTRTVLVGLRAEEVALLSLLEVELWHARKRHWEAGAAEVETPGYWQD